VDLLIRLRQPFVLTCLAAALGALWGHSPAALALVPGIWGVLWLARTRLQAWWLMSLYHGVAARALVVGATRYFSLSLLEACALVAVGAALASVPYAAVWCAPTRHVRPAELCARVLAASALSSLPPLCALAVVSPLPAAGLWFPHSGWLGLCGLVFVLAWLRRDSDERLIVVRGQRMMIATLLAYGAATAWPSQAHPGIDAVGTRYASSASDLFDFGHQWDVAQGAMHLAQKSVGNVIVLPESTAGLWQVPMARAWAPLHQKLRVEGRIALIGTTLKTSDGALQAAAVLVGASEDVYRQRVPLPFFMWRPWSAATDAFVSNFYGRGVVESPVGTLGVLICWELGSSWAVLSSVAQGAEALVVLANTAWLRGTYALAAQRQVLAGWGSLFALPTVLAVNE
jgi:apolipoprotein N-acyltransferase